MAEGGHLLDFSEGCGLVDIVEVHPGLGASSYVLGVVDQNLVMFDGGCKQQLLVVLELVDVVFESIEVLLQILYFFGFEEVKDPSEDGGSHSDGNRDRIEESFVPASGVRECFRGVLLG